MPEPESPNPQGAETDDQAPGNPDSGAPDPESPNRARLIFAGVLVAGLALAALLIPLLAGGGEEAAAVPADSECIDAWNDERVTVLFGQHQFTAHRYSAIQVLRLAEDGADVADGEEGNCAVIFAANTLDPEPGAAAQIYNGRKWEPLSERPGVKPERLGELQSQALAEANATLTSAGTLEPQAPATQ
jgi:hypothetical protein